MESLQFQYQYTANDLQAIRSANGVTRVSPGTTMTIWASGLAICLWLLAAIGSWAAVAMMLLYFAVFLIVHVLRSNSRRLGDREYHWRTLTLTDIGVAETSANSAFEKTWSAFQDFEETKDHFLLRHYDKLTALPKRVIAADQLPICRELFRQRVGQLPETELPSFRQWFAAPAKTPIYRFRWDDSDVQALAAARLQPFDASRPIVATHPAATGKRGWWLLLLVIGGLLILMVLVQAGTGAGFASAINVVVFPLAISIPFVVAYIWWRYTSSLAAKREPRIPLEEIRIFLSDTDLLIGYPQAVARYSLQDISSFFVGERFIGFRPHHGLVHVIANRAFGGIDPALDFVRRAEELRKSEEVQITGATPKAAATETGNPYQPPRYLN